MSNKKIRFLFLIILVLFLYFINNKKEESPNGIHIDSDHYPIHGIDLSEYSGNVNFSNLKNEVDIDFVYLRASAGKNYKDKNLERNYKNAISNEYLVGFYHYYRFNEDPIKQADFFLSCIKNKQNTLPYVIDVEDWGNKSGNKPKKEISKEIELYIKHVKEKTNSEIIIYTNESGYNTYVSEKLDEFEIWICSFKRDVKINNHWLFWQYSHKGKYKAIEGWVDLNTFNGGEEEWKEFLKR